MDVINNQHLKQILTDVPSFCEEFSEKSFCELI